MAWAAPLVHPSVPAYSWRFEHAVFVSSPVALITSLASRCQKISPISTGDTPGLLSRATRQFAMMVQ
eukprot:226254-Ditylum_brightwellii.AAC.2